MRISPAENPLSKVPGRTHRGTITSLTTLRPVAVLTIATASSAERPAASDRRIASPVVTKWAATKRLFTSLTMLPAPEGPTCGARADIACSTGRAMA